MKAKTHQVFGALIFAIIGLFAVSACSVLETAGEDRNQIYFQYATAKIIDGDTDTAASILREIEKYRPYIEDGPDVTLGKLRQGAIEIAREKGMDEADIILLSAVLSRAEQRLQSEIGEGVLDEEQRLQLSVVLDWIEDTARGYVPS